MALITSRLFIETSNLPNVHCFDRSEQLQTYSNVFFLRSDLPIFAEFSDVFERIVTSRLIPKWVKDLRIPSQLIDDTASAKPFTLHSAIGPFCVCGPTLLLAIVVAIIEHIIYRQYSANRRSRFWRLAQKLIDGKRHYFLWNWK